MDLTPWRRSVASFASPAVHWALGLSLHDVGCAVDLSMSSLSRIERGLKPNVSLVVLVQLCEVVGLELSTKVYPGGRALRDARHAARSGGSGLGSPRA